MSDPSYEEVMGISPERRAPPLQSLPGAEEIKNAPIEPSAPPSYNEIMGVDEGAPNAKGKKESDFRTPEYLANKAKLGMASLLSLGGIPLDFINELQYMAYDMFGIDVHNQFLDTTRKPIPYGFNEQKKAYEKVLFADFNIEEPDDFGMRTLGTISEFAGGGLIPGAGIVSKTQGAVPKIIAGGAEVASTIIGGVGSEIGAEVGKSIDSNLETSGRVIGGVFGSMSPYMLPTAISKIYSRIRGWLDPATQAQIGRRNAVELIKKELVDVGGALDQLAESERLRKNIPGYSPSLGMETDSAGIKSLEKRFSQESIKGYELAKQAEEKSLKAIINKANEVFPENFTNLTSLPEERLSQVRSLLKGEITQVDDKIKALESTITRGDPEKTGQQLRLLRDQKEQLARSIKNSNYEEFYRVAEDSNVTISPETIRTMAKNVLGDEALTFQRKSPVIRRIVDKYVVPKPGSDAVPFVDQSGRPLPVPENDISIREFHSLYKEVNREIGVAYQGMQRGDQEAAHLYYQLRQMKDEFAKNLDILKGSEYGVVADKLKEADAFFLNDYQKVFREGVGGRMDAYNRFGDVTPDEKIVKDLILARGSGVDDFYKIYGESQEAQTLLENGVTDLFARSAIRDGSYNPSGAIAFLEKHDDVLNKLPELKSLLMDKNKGYQVLVNRQAVLDAKLKGIKKSKLEQLTGMNNTEEVIAAAMADPKRIQTLKRTISKTGDPGSAEALRYGVAKHAMKQKDPFEYFLENEKQMQIVYGKNTDHYKTLKDLAEARRVLSRKFSAQQVNTSLSAEDPLKKAIGTSAVEAMTMARWVNAGRLSPEYVISQMTSRGVLKFRQEEMNRVMEQALYDPGVAKTLLEFAVTEGKLKPLSSMPRDTDFAIRLKEILFSIGARNTAVIAAKDELNED